MASTLKSLNDLVGKPEFVNGVKIDNAKQAAEEAVIRQEAILKFKIQELENNRHWLQQMFSKNGAGEFIDNTREFVAATSHLKTLIDNKKDKDDKYCMKMAAMNNMLVSADDVIEKMKMAATYNNLQTETALYNSIQLLHTATQEMSKHVEKSAFQRILGTVAIMVGAASYVLGVSYGSFLNVGLGIMNVILGINLVSASENEKQVSRVNDKVTQLTGTINNLFKPVPVTIQPHPPETNLGYENQDNQPLYPPVYANR